MYRRLTVSPLCCAANVWYEHGGFRHRHTPVLAGGPGLVGHVAVDDGLAVSDMPVRVGGAMALGVGQKDVIVHGDPGRDHTRGSVKGDLIHLKHLNETWCTHCWYIRIVHLHQFKMALLKCANECSRKETRLLHYVYTVILYTRAQHTHTHRHTHMHRYNIIMFILRIYRHTPYKKHEINIANIKAYSCYWIDLKDYYKK